jgi:hypothetical protein
MTNPYFGLNINDAELLQQNLKANNVEVTDIIRRADHIEFLLTDLDGNKVFMTQWFNALPNNPNHS